VKRRSSTCRPHTYVCKRVRELRRCRAAQRLRPRRGSCVPQTRPPSGPHARCSARSSRHAARAIASPAR
jgi:hypothetical protein